MLGIIEHINNGLPIVFVDDFFLNDASRIDEVYVYNFWYDSISLKKETMSFMLTFLNSSSILFLLKKLFLMRAKARHSMRRCLTVHGFWRVIYCGFLLEYKEVRKSFVTNSWSGYCDLFLSWFLESCSLFYQIVLLLMHNENISFINNL